MSLWFVKAEYNQKCLMFKQMFYLQTRKPMNDNQTKKIFFVFFFSLCLWYLKSLLKDGNKMAILLNYYYLFCFVLFSVRKQHIDECLRVEYTTAGDDEVWIPPGNF